MKSIPEVYLSFAQYPLDGWRFLTVSGTDAKSYLQSQTTQDIFGIQNEMISARWSTRLTPKGKLVGQFFISFDSKLNGYLLCCPPQNSSALKENLEKNIISEDVVINEDLSQKYVCYWGVPTSDIVNVLGPTLIIPYALGTLLLVDKSTKVFDRVGNIPVLTKEQIQQIEFWGMLPRASDFEETTSRFINETILDLFAISYSKGCFIGQETVAKIHNLRGAVRHPIFLQLSAPNSSLQEGMQVTGQVTHGNNEIIGEFIDSFSLENITYWRLNAAKVARVEGLDFNLNLNIEEINDPQLLKAKTLLPPIFSGYLIESIVDFYVQLASEKFSIEGNIEFAISLLEFVLVIDPKNLQAIESLGVILGKKGDIHRGISLMEKLVQHNPETVLGYTNLSVFHMKLGNIPTAEEYKAKAMVNEFKTNAKNKTSKVTFATGTDEAELQTQRKLKMFEQVLDIDLHDEVANVGIAEICFNQMKDDKAQAHAEKALIGNKSSSKALLILGKILKRKGQIGPAIEKLIQARDVASKKGEAKLAGEAQSLIVSFQAENNG